MVLDQSQTSHVFALLLLLLHSTLLMECLELAILLFHIAHGLSLLLKEQFSVRVESNRILFWFCSSSPCNWVHSTQIKKSF